MLNRPPAGHAAGGEAKSHVLHCIVQCLQNHVRCGVESSRRRPSSAWPFTFTAFPATRGVMSAGWLRRVGLLGQERVT